LICKRTSACQWKETPALWTHLEVCAGQEIQKKSSSRAIFIYIISRLDYRFRMMTVISFEVK